MPLKPGGSKETVSGNIKEFHTGQTYAHTKEKFGKTRADKQAVAASLENARRTGGKSAKELFAKKGAAAKPGKARPQFQQG